MAAGFSGPEAGTRSERVWTSCAQAFPALAGTLSGIRRAKSGLPPRAAFAWLQSDPAVLLPMPGSIRAMRLKATSSRGFMANFRNAATSLTWACSKNRSPLVIENGIPRFVSSICTSIEW